MTSYELAPVLLNYLQNGCGGHCTVQQMSAAFHPVFCSNEENAEKFAQYRLRFAVRVLKNAGLVRTDMPKGYYRLTPKGKRLQVLTQAMITASERTAHDVRR